MAAQLAHRKVRAVTRVDLRALRLPPYALGAGVAAALLVLLASLVVALHTAHRDEAAAHRRFDDAQALLAVPAVAPAKLQSELRTAKASLATASASSASPSDLTVDGSMELLVRHAQALGVSVKGISRADQSQLKLSSGTYDVRGIHMTLDAPLTQINALLAELGNSEPSLVPRLETLRVDDNGSAHADVTFNSYSAVVPVTPAAGRAATPRPSQ